MVEPREYIFRCAVATFFALMELLMDSLEMSTASSPIVVVERRQH